MRIVTNTNIIVDDFDYCKNYPKQTFIHFLTHFHQDHWFGLTPLWDYGQIYCSPITRILILNKFPLLDKFITTFPLNQSNSLILNNDCELLVNVTFFNAHHIPGSIMILFQGYMGSILHTGDFRFIESMIEENQGLLYPSDKINKGIENCSIHIDELIFDNTYCNPMFIFPKSDVVVEMMKKIIDKNRKKNVIITMGALGKEDICAKLAEYYQTLIVISEQKFKQIEALGLRTDLFTTKSHEGWIEIISKKDRIKRLEKEQENKNLDNIICITTDFLMLEHKDPDGVNFIVPYSLHSNFKEMETFIKTIKPSILRKLVVPFERFPQERNKNFDCLKVFLNYTKSLNKNGESSYSLFKKLHTDFLSLSEEYKYWMNSDRQKSLRKKLGIAEQPDIRLRKRKVKNLEEINQMLELEKMFGKTEKGESLNDIAMKLNATHNNKSIKSFLVKRKENVSVKGIEFEKKIKRFDKIDNNTKSCRKGNFVDCKILSLLDDFTNSKD